MINSAITNGQIKLGHVYCFRNKAYPKYALNVWSDKDYPQAKLSNVCLWEYDKTDIAQKWVVTSSTWGAFIQPLKGSSFSLYLDRYTGSGAGAGINAHLYTPSDTSLFDILTASQDSVKIKVADKNLYLTAYGGTNGKRTGRTNKSEGNAFFAAGSNSPTQEWIPVDNSSSGGTTTEVTVTDMPKIGTYQSTGYKEYFHSGSGMKNGTWKANGGENIAKKILAFYKKVFKEEPTEDRNSTEEENPSESKYLYSLFGQKTISDDPKFNLTYHHGFDINKYAGATVKTAHAGVVTKATGNTIAIYDEGKDVTYLYLHCNIGVKKGDTLKIGDVIGTQGNRGLGYGDNLVKGSHLHFEVKAGRDNVAQAPSTDVTVALPSLNPYDYLPTA